MFVQVLQGKPRDEAGLRRQLERWRQELAPGAEGWLGTTMGVADQGEFIAVVRFESEAAARRNSDRPEQGRWWSETARYFEGDPIFYDCREVDVLDGGSDDAGFVQVIQGRTGEQERLRRLLAGMAGRGLKEHRPDVIGSTVAWHGDGGFTQTVYFTSEQEARAGERREPPPELRRLLDEYRQLVHDLRYLDLRQPWLQSP